jgi:hypothetical protein
MNIGMPFSSCSAVAARFGLLETFSTHRAIRSSRLLAKKSFIIGGAVFLAFQAVLLAMDGLHRFFADPASALRQSRNRQSKATLTLCHGVQGACFFLLLNL